MTTSVKIPPYISLSRPAQWIPQVAIFSTMNQLMHVICGVQLDGILIGAAMEIGIAAGKNGWIG